MEKTNELQTQFLAAFDAYSDAIFRFCLLKVSKTEVAEDITQEVFIRYWQSMLKGDVFNNERAFLYAVARNLVIDWYRKRKDQSLDASLEAGIDFKGEGSDSVTKDSEISEVLAIIQELDAIDREVLLLRYVEGFSPKEISSLLNESTNVISVRIHRALKKVQETMGIESNKGKLDLS